MIGNIKSYRHFLNKFSMTWVIFSISQSFLAVKYQCPWMIFLIHTWPWWGFHKPALSVKTRELVSEHIYVIAFQSSDHFTFSTEIWSYVTLSCSRRHQSYHNGRKIGRFKPRYNFAMQGWRLLNRGADVITGLSRRHPCWFSKGLPRYLQDISTYLSCTAQRVLRTTFMQKYKPKYACLPSKIVEVWIYG